MDGALAIRTATHISSCMGIVLNLYGGFLILKRSYKEMGRYRYCLLLILFSAVLFDVGVTLIAQVDPILPYYCATVAPWINIFLQIHSNFRPEKLGAYVYYILCLDAGLMGSALAISFLYRAYVLATSEIEILIKRFFYTFLIYLGFMIPVLGFVIMNAFVKEDKLETFKAEHPEILLKIAGRPFFLFNISSSALAVVMLGFFVFFFLFVGGVSISCIVFVFRRLHKLRRCMSVTTRKQHQMYTVALMVHASIPVFFYYLPFIFAFGSILNGHMHSEVLGNIAALLFSLHCSANVCVLVIFITPYRRATICYFGYVFSSLIRIWNANNSVAAATSTVDISSSHLEPSLQ